MSDNSQHTDGSEADSNSGLMSTRRGALALFGGGLTASLGTVGNAGASATVTSDQSDSAATRQWNRDVDANDHDLRNLNRLDVQHVHASARDADVIVWKDDEGTYHADGRDRTVASGSRLLAVTQAAIDSLTDGRTSKEKVLVTASGEVSSNDDTLDLPSYTVLDAPTTMTVPDGESGPLVVRAKNAEHIDIQSLMVKGAAGGGIRLTSCSNVHLGDIRLSGVSGDGVRIDGRGDAPRSTDIQVDSVYIEETGHHGFETYGVDRIQIDQIIGINPESCVVLLNDTTDATVNSVVGEEPGMPAGYATFRVANGAHDITVGEVISRGGARGIFGVSECYDITIGEVNIVGAEYHGALVQNCQNFTIDGGVIKNGAGEAIRVDSRNSDDPNNSDQTPAEGVCISNLRIVDDRDEKQQSWGILETGPETGNNRYVNNDIRDAGTEGGIAIFSNSTVVRDNVGGGLASGTVTLSGGSSPAARVEGVTDFDDRAIPGSVDDLESFEPSTLSTRAKPTTTGTPVNYAWESYYEWDGVAGAWDLVFEWRTDPGIDIEVDYIVDKTR